MSHTFIKDLAKIDWVECADGIVLTPTVKTCSTTMDRVTYSFNFSNLAVNLPVDYINWVVCGIKICPAEGMIPPGGDGADESPFSVSLRRDNFSLFGIPGDFTMAYYGKWMNFTYPMPVGFLLNTHPEVYVERYRKAIERICRNAEKPSIAIYLRRVQDISNYNYVFVISNSLGGRAADGSENGSCSNYKIMRVYQHGRGIFPIEYYAGNIPGPMKIIPSWGLIKKGWLDINSYYHSMTRHTLDYNLSNLWIKADDQTPVTNTYAAHTADAADTNTTNIVVSLDKTPSKNSVVVNINIQ